MNDFSESDAPFSFQQLLYGDDWQRWDTYPSVDVNASLLHAMVEMNHGGDEPWWSDNGGDEPWWSDNCRDEP